MPLTRVEREPVRDAKRKGLLFVMLDDHLKVVCILTDEAADLLGPDNCIATIDRIARFFSHRDQIERAASELYDRKRFASDNVIVVTPADLPLNVRR
jgi:hypothetical protein